MEQREEGPLFGLLSVSSYQKVEPHKGRALRGQYCAPGTWRYVQLLAGALVSNCRENLYNFGCVHLCSSTKHV